MIPRKHWDGAGRPARRRLGAHATLSAVALVAIGLLLCGCSGPVNDPAESTTAPSSVNDEYGTLPSFLPNDAVNDDRVLTGAVGAPALTVEGDSVDVKLADATVRATVSGPVVPGEGLPYQAEATTCTWTVTLSGATSTVPLSAQQFTTLDHLGVRYKVVTLPGQPALPASVSPGQTLTFDLRAVMPTGEGIIRWAPDGTHIVASWDFEVEND